MGAFGRLLIQTMGGDLGHYNGDKPKPKEKETVKTEKDEQ